MDVLEKIRELAIQILPPGSKITLFGSRARQTHRIDSDYDIHILVPGSDKLSLTQLDNYGVPFIQLGWDLGVDIEPLVHTYSGWEKRWFLPLYKNIKKDGITIYDSCA